MVSAWTWIAAGTIGHASERIDHDANRHAAPWMRQLRKLSSVVTLTLAR